MERLTYSAHGLQRLTFDTGDIVVRLSPETSAALERIERNRPSIEEMAQAGEWEVRIRGKRIPCPQCSSAGCARCNGRGWIRGAAWIDLAEWLAQRSKRGYRKSQKKSARTEIGQRQGIKAPAERVAYLAERYAEISAQYGAELMAGEGETARPMETSELDSIPALTIDDNELADLLVNAAGRGTRAIADNVSSFGQTGKAGENDE